MNLMGYLVTLYNIQSFSESGGPLRDISVRVSEVHRLAEELRALPEFPMEGFKETGFFRVGNCGKYLSNNLRDFIYNEKYVNPRDEGVILTLIYDNTLGYFGNHKGTDGATTFYRPKTAVAVNDDDNDDDDDDNTYGGTIVREKRAIPV